MFKLSRTVLSVFLLFVGAIGVASADSVYNFQNAANADTPFSVASNGLTATFASNGDPEGFEVIPTVGLFKSLTGNALGNFNPNPLSLSISFSGNVNSISLDFATSGPGVFTLSTFENGLAVASVIASGVVPNGFQFPEGAVALTGGAFNEVLITSTAKSFTVDNIDVKPVATATPEPASLALLGLSLAAVAAVLRNRRS
jgi:hypothetical protein